MGRDTIQLETAVSTISSEYLLEFTSEYGIAEELHPELPSPGDRIVDFSEGKANVLFRISTMDQRFFMQNPMLHVPPENIEFEGEIIPCSDFRLGTSQPLLNDQALTPSQETSIGSRYLRFSKTL
ncbi:hypothetical protein Tco_0410961 [Tanacetum coccineum]